MNSKKKSFPAQIEKKMSKLQSVGFMREDGWTLAQVYSFLKRHKLQPLDPDEPYYRTRTQYRVRLMDPRQFGTYATKITYSKGKRMLLTIGFPKKRRRTKKSGRKSRA